MLNKFFYIFPKEKNQKKMKIKKKILLINIFFFVIKKQSICMKKKLLSPNIPSTSITFMNSILNKKKN